MAGRAPSAGSPTLATAMSQYIDRHHLSFAQHSYRLAILPEDDPKKRGDKCDET
jgi:hypothetical protein